MSRKGFLRDFGEGLISEGAKLGKELGGDIKKEISRSTDFMSDRNSRSKDRKGRR